MSSPKNGINDGNSLEDVRHPSTADHDATKELPCLSNSFAFGY